MLSVGRRPLLFVIAITLAVLAAAGGAAFLVASSFSGYSDRAADQRAQSAVDLLVSVGGRLPRLDERALRRGLTNRQGAFIDRAVAEGQRAGTLADLTIWDASGRVVYSASPSLEGTRPAMEPEVRAALTGQSITHRHPTELDLSSGQRTGVLDAFEPLTDKAGRIFGAVETSLPLKPIVDGASSVQRRILLILFGGALGLWLLALPLVARSARLAVDNWVPGRRKTLRAFGLSLARDEIEMVYQPQVDPSEGTVHALEALVRWRRNGTLQPPDSFLPIVEASPLMAKLTDRVLELALDELRRCYDAGHSLRMSVNCSSRDLADVSLPDRVRDALLRAGIQGWRLTLEVTETAILEDIDTAHTVLRAIRDLGVEIAVDDFGTGHASISRLHRLPVDEVKIDRSFMTSDDRSRSYVHAITSFARTLGLRVVAEGVEDRATMLLLHGAGCDLAQGYYISKPLSGDEIRSWLDEREPSETCPAVEAPLGLTDLVIERPTAHPTITQG